MKTHILNLFDEIDTNLAVVDLRLAELRAFAETLPDDPTDPPDPPDPPVDPPVEPPVEPPPDGSEIIPGIPGSWIKSPLAPKYRRGFLWKPIADGNQPLVVLTAGEAFTEDQARNGFVIDGAGAVHKRLRYTGIGNANQHHQRFAKYGYEFSGSCMYAVPLTPNTYAIWIIPSPANRHEGPGVDAYLLTRAAVEPEEPVPDDPPVDPAPVTPPGEGVLGSNVWTWREFSGVWTGVGINAPQIAFSGVGEGHIRTIYGNGEQWGGVHMYVDRAHRAKSEGAVGTCIDLESHFLARGPDDCAAVYNNVKGILPCSMAPKVFLDHFIHAMDARPEQMLETMAVVWGMSFDQAAGWLQANSDFLIPWSYNQNAAGWIGLVEKFRSAGYTKPMILLGELYRTWDGARPWTEADIKTLLANGQTIAGFLPDASFNDSPELVKASPAYKYLKRLKA